MKQLFLLLLGSACFIQGCSNLPQRQGTAEIPPATYQPGEFNQESLYALMLAEIAGQRRLFPLALEQYLEQAEKTRDPGVVERAARIAQYLRDSENILITARLWRDISPENPEPYQIEAAMLLHQGEHKQALPLIQKAVSFDPLRTLALIRSQADKLTRDQASAYLIVLREYKTTVSPRADLELTLAMLHEREDAIQDATTAYDRALQLEPLNPEALVNKAEMLRDQNQPAAALKLIQTAFEQQPDNRQLHILYTQLLFAAEKPDSAVEQAQLLIDNNLKDHQLTYYLGLLMLENEQLDSAEAVLQSLFDLKPDDSSPHFYLGHISQSREDNAQAVEHYLSVRHGNNILSALSRMTALLNDPEQRDFIEVKLQEARSALPELSSRIYNLEAEWLNIHNFAQDAEALLEEALTAHPGDTNLLYARAMLVESYDFPQAEKDLRQILQQNPDNSMAKNALGYTLTLHTERFQEAYELISSALKSEPEDPAILDSMGWVLHLMGRSEEGLPYLEKAHNLYADPEVSSHLIQAYWITGQRDKALALLTSSEKEHPDNPFLLEARAFVEAPENAKP